jgi:hypothetical protein
MNGNPVLVGLAVLLVFSSCDRPPEGRVERRFELPDSLGTLAVQLDTNLSSTGQWIHASDYRCGREQVQGYAHGNWPIYRDTSYITLFPDSLFQFTLRYTLYSPKECGWTLSTHGEQSFAEEWLSHTLRMRHQESLTWKPIDQGLMEINGVQWAFIQMSDSTSLHNDEFACVTSHSGRGMKMTWQRVAPSAITFDFGAYARRQFETARFD